MVEKFEMVSLAKPLFSLSVTSILTISRTAFNTAVALAEFENEQDAKGNVMLQQHHLEQVVKMSRSFQDYIEATLRMKKDVHDSTPTSKGFAPTHGGQIQRSTYRAHLVGSSY
jgi:hypothetical protein